MSAASIITTASPILKRRTQAAPERIITWKEKAAWHDPKYVPVWIDVLKLDGMLPLGPLRHVGFAGEQGINGKYAGVDKFVRRCKALYMAEVGIEPAKRCQSPH
jgi:hypothetical protein